MVDIDGVPHHAAEGRYCLIAVGDEAIAIAEINWQIRLATLKDSKYPVLITMDQACELVREAQTNVLAFIIRPDGDGIGGFVS